MYFVLLCYRKEADALRRLTTFLLRTFCMLLTALVLSSSLTAYAEYDAEHPELLTEDDITAVSCILIEQSTGDVIFEKDADAILYPASTTKILTILLGIMMGDMSQTVYLSDTAMWGIQDGDSVMDLEVGESIKFEDLLYGTFIRSANEGANLIAETISGSSDAFANVMNEAAAMYGCTSTHFMNPNGLHDPNH